MARQDCDHQNRSVKIYPVTEYELRDIHSLARDAAFHYGLAGLCIGAIGAAIFVGIECNDGMYFVPVGALVPMTLAMLALGGYFRQRSKRIVDLIFAQCGEGSE